MDYRKYLDFLTEIRKLISSLFKIFDCLVNNNYDLFFDSLADDLK